MFTTRIDNDGGKVMAIAHMNLWVTWDKNVETVKEGQRLLWHHEVLKYSIINATHQDVSHDEKQTWVLNVLIGKW